MIKNYIVYDKETGKILKTGSCPEDHVAMQAGEGEAVMEGTACDKTCCIKRGKIKKIKKS